MKRTAPLPALTTGLFRGLTLLAALGCLLQASCTGVRPNSNTNANDNGNANANDNASTTITAEIISLKLNFAVSQLDDPFTVDYTVGGAGVTQIDAYYVPVADASPGAGPIGQQIVFQTNLPIGNSQSFVFDPGVVDVGFYRLGIVVSAGSLQITRESNGVVQVQGPPSPVFIQPSSPVVEIEADADIKDVIVTFDCQDPENDVQWRLFYLEPGDNPNAPVDTIGNLLATGAGNVGNQVFNTTQLAPGSYTLGLSATDTGSSVVTTVAEGDADRVLTTFGPIITILAAEPLPTPPTITFTAPPGDVELFLNEALTIGFVGQVFEAGAEGKIDIFYDLDTTFANGYTLIDENLPPQVTSVAFPTGLPEGVYNVGAAIRDGISPQVVVYADFQVTVITTIELTVTSPAVDVTIPPAEGDDPATATISWSTSVPSGGATVDVYAQTVNAAGQPFGAEIPILTGVPVTTTSAAFTSEDSGVFAIFVRLEFTDTSVASVTEQAPGFVRVSSLPRIAWLGELATDDSSFDGAIFEGVQPEDNLGSAMTSAGDMDGDGADEFCIVARYGKPFFQNPSGIGEGEGYLLFGGSGGNKPSGRFNINSTGTTGLVGVTLTGIATLNANSETDGLSDVTLIPDADGDGLGELVFGFPRTNSAGFTVSALESPGQFLNGGVVIVSSDNILLQNPQVGLTPVINLDAVGQVFESEDGGLAGVDDIFSPIEEIAVDAFAISTDPETPGCIEGTDGFNDTVVGPFQGFIPQLAPPLYAIQGAILPGAPCSLNIEDSEGDAFVNECPFLFGPATGVPGSGFFEREATMLDPKGARIIGMESGDGFGTSVTFSNSLDDGSPGDLIITAPNRTATPAFVSGITTNIQDSGVAYLTDNRNFWGPDDFFGNGETPPYPAQYMIGIFSHCGDDRSPPATTLSIAGDASDKIRNVVGIEDFNEDGRNDFAVGAPNSNGGQGRVYVAFRREESLEGDFVLPKLELSPSNSERLDGVLIVANSTSALGASLATGVDFNGDGISDLVIGAPNANAGVGEVIVVFGDSSLSSPADGVTVQQLLVQKGAGGKPRAARITGNPADANGQFGFNVANAGDVDGDGLDDLLIAAPNSTPRFDPDPTDGLDELTVVGVDVDGDGIKDDVSGPLGIPDGLSDSFDNLEASGLVYLISSKNRLDQIPTTDVTISVSELGSNALRGLMIAGWHAGDRLGGGDAGDIASGGLIAKLGRGRSEGLSGAGDVDSDGRADILIGAILADPRIDPATGVGVKNAGEAYLIYGSIAP